MQGSFSSDSAKEFLKLMAEEGYDVGDTLTGKDRENFSGGVSNTVDPWQGNVANFGEVRGEYIENYDYTRCVRPDGSAYGTGGKCRKGTESAEEMDAIGQLSRMLPKGEKIVGSSGAVHKSKGEKPKATEKTASGLMKKYKDLYLKVEEESRKLKKMLKGPKTDTQREARKAKIAKLRQALAKIAKARDAINSQLDHDAKKTGRPRQLMPDDWQGFSESDNYDFARCVRPDGSVYGTRGKCRKGKETSAKPSQERSAQEILKELDKLPKGTSPKKEALLKEYFDKVGTASAPGKKIKDPVPGVIKSQEDLKDFNRKENQRITDLVAAGKVKGVDPDAIRRIRAKKMMDRINRETDPEKQRDLINQLEEINNPLVKLPGGRVARSREVKSPPPDPKKVWSELKPRVDKLKSRKEEEVRRQSGVLIGDSPRNMAIKGIQEYHNRLLDSRSEAETKLLKELLEKSLDKLEKTA